MQTSFYKLFHNQTDECLPKFFWPKIRKLQVRWIITKFSDKDYLSYVDFAVKVNEYAICSFIAYPHYSYAIDALTKMVKQRRGVCIYENRLNRLI
jgi:hypothetical protein